MIIKSITFRNFKSFGNNKQTIKFDTNNGELILISAKNGNGKSSIQQSIDFSLFGIVRGKNGKRIPQSILPNRVNKNLETEIEFINNKLENIKIQRNLEPNSVKVFINDEDKTKYIKNVKKEELIDFDFDTYKSFISMSVSDFANFIDLSLEDKRKIINKLFNLQDLDSYLTLCNGKIKLFNDEKTKYLNIINYNNETVNKLKQNIISINKSGILNKENEIKKLEKRKESKRDPYIKLKKNIQEITSKISEIDLQLQDLDNQKNVIMNNIFELKVNIKNINEKNKIYESGICPFCDTILNDNSHQHNLNEIIEKQKTLNKEYKELDNNKNNIILRITQLSNEKDSLIRQKNSYITQFNNITYELKNITKNIVELKNDNNNSVSIDELNKNLNDLKNKNSENNDKIIEFDKNIKIYEELKNIFSINGIRKNIIKNIIKPINVYLKELLDELNSQYNVKIDDEFNVNIYERLTMNIHPETLSTGEAKKINIAIALSYLKLILKFKKLNIIFLDEVFSSMNPENVEYVLKLLKKFTKEYNLNIIIIDPLVYFREDSDFGYSYFNKIININKKSSFSNIEQKIIN